MATNSDKKLTRYTSAVTVVTADVMNSFFGGEYGHNTTADPNDPLVAGHVHDGEHADGHASKIILTDGKHVTGVITHDQLGGSGGTTPAVQYENIQCYSESVYGKHAPGVAIPEYTTSEGGERCYYLDLSMTIGGSDKNVQYNNATEFGGDDGFVYDYSTGRVGIGVAAPDYMLQVENDSNEATIAIVENIDASSGPVFRLKKSRLGAIVNNNDNLGTIIVSGYDGDSYEIGGGIQFRADGTPANNNMPMEIRLVTRPTGIGTTNWDDHTRMIIRSDGNIGINEVDPETMLHIVGDGYTSPLRLDNVLAGEGVVLVIDGYSGDVHFDASIGSPQMLFETVALSAAGGGVSGDSTIVADQIDDTLSLKAGNNIALEGDDIADSITIEAVAGGSDGHIQYNDTNEFDGDGGLLYNKTPGGAGVAGVDGAHAGPKITLHNTTKGDNDYDRYSSISFSGREVVLGTTDLTANIGGFHHSFGSGSAVGGRGGFYIQTFNNDDDEIKAAFLVDSGDKNPQDLRGYVGIGAIDPDLSTTDADGITRFEPKRKLHIKETPPTNPSAHSPLRINQLQPGMGDLMVWNSVSTTGWDSGVTVLPDAGDVYCIPKGNIGDFLRLSEGSAGAAAMEWAPIGKTETNTALDTTAVAPHVGVFKGSSVTKGNIALGSQLKMQAAGKVQRNGGALTEPAPRYGLVLEDPGGTSRIAFVSEQTTDPGTVVAGDIDEWRFEITVTFMTPTSGNVALHRDVGVSGTFQTVDGNSGAVTSDAIRVFGGQDIASSTPSAYGSGMIIPNVPVVVSGCQAKFVAVCPNAIPGNAPAAHTGGNGLDIVIQTLSTQVYTASMT